MKALSVLPLATLAGICMTCGDARTQGQGGLLYTTLRTETSPQGGAIAPAVSQVLDEEVQYLNPTAVAAPQSLAFAPQVGYAELLGDFDADGSYWENPLLGKNDALVRPRGTGGVIPAVDMHTLFISTTLPLVNAAGLVRVSPGDVFRILPGGMIELLISEAQIKAAFGIPASVSIDVDAAAMHSEAGGYGILVSLESDLLTALFPVRDGDVLRIPAGAVTLVPSGYDGCLIVGGVAANSGMVMIQEAAMDAMCVTSGVSDPLGAPVPLIIDVDGLTSDSYGTLWFCGEGLRGGSVLTGFGGGAIATLNGAPLGNPVGVPTTGPQVGLLPVVRSLNGLSLVIEASTFVTDTLTPTGPGLITIEAAGRPPGSLVWFLLNLLPDAPGGPADPSTPFPNPCFPQLYPFMTFGGPLLTGPTGCVAFGGPVPALPGWHITAQGLSITLAGVLPLSTPTVVDL